MAKTRHPEMVTASQEEASAFHEGWLDALCDHPIPQYNNPLLETAYQRGIKKGMREYEAMKQKEDEGDKK